MCLMISCDRLRYFILSHPESSGIPESAPPLFHLSAWSGFHMTKTQSPQAAASLSLTPPFLPPSWIYIFLAQSLQAASIPTSVKMRFKQSLPSLDPSWEFQSNSIQEWLSRHIWLTSMRHRLLLRRGWGKVGGSRGLLSSRVSRRSWFITSGRLSVILRDSRMARGNHFYDKNVAAAI